MKLSKEGLDQLKLDEGYREKPYRCTAGHLTIGWGHNLDALGLAREFVIMVLQGEKPMKEILELVLLDDVKNAMKAMVMHPSLAWLFDEAHTNEVRREAFVNLVFNMGLVGLLAFRKALAAGQAGRWDECSAELKNSRWFHQVGDGDGGYFDRAERIVLEVATGERKKA